MQKYMAGKCMALPPAIFVATWLLAVAALGNTADAASLSRKDLQIFAKAVGFLEPPPTGTLTVAIAYNADSADSKQDADGIAANFGDELKAGGATLKAKVVASKDLKGGGPFIAIITAAGALNDTVSSVARDQHALCVTADSAAIAAGTCVMTVKSDPVIEIAISKAGAESSSVKFSSAFLLMAHEN
jgi:hypothetical protein